MGRIFDLITNGYKFIFWWYGGEINVVIRFITDNLEAKISRVGIWVTPRYVYRFFAPMNATIYNNSVERDGQIVPVTK